MVERVLADQLRRQVVRDDPERGQPALHRRGFADPVETVLAPHPDKGAALLRLVLRRPGDLKGLNFGDFHSTANRCLALESMPRRGCSVCWQFPNRKSEFTYFFSLLAPLSPSCPGLLCSIALRRLFSQEAFKI